MTKLQLVVGLEMHCELKSNAKVFSTGINKYSDTANCHVSPVDMAFPGTLPIVNKKCIEHAIKMASVLNCTLADKFIFDRKNYYYPDLPKGYQITQCTKPIGVNGYIDLPCQDRVIRAEIHDIHLEEDAASLDHFKNTSTIDYNRAGVPLLEIVTEPCFYSADEAVAFLEYMRNVYQYTDISLADTKKGQIRCDVNVNLKNEKGEYVTPRVEIKNVNSFSNVHDAILYEEKRQLKALEENNLEELVQETRRWDEETNSTIRMRTKVDAIDYKYFIDPNIPPIKIDKNWVEKIVKTIPRLPLERQNSYMKEYGLSAYDAKILVKDKDIASYFEECINLGLDAKMASNWITVNIVTELNKDNSSIKDFYITPKYLKQILDRIADGTISNKQAKDVFSKALEEKKEPQSFISKENSQISNEDELRDIITEIINNNLGQKEAYLNGKTNLFDYFVGQVMKQTRGKANPVKTKEILSEELNK
ncbi:MAG TPA: Asp-tRNA(Asn)/Glu-tRNA(Gln) amidotransferase GatCAB subunit B [Firmicutes bacterium]|nr:Asp-tRNA(Asn)/Glu-tRNA(Gln) amidotransferase GatCAB subunit B [Bacillota bacterium]